MAKLARLQKHARHLFEQLLDVEQIKLHAALVARDVNWAHCPWAAHMDDETLNLYDDDDDDYLSGNEMMDQNEDGHDSIQDDSTSAAGNRGRRRRNKRRHSKCWKHFEIVGDKLPDGTTKVICKH
uniref:Uncharacterized protein n=1 Tax=Brassica oleracea var. oleracea TaxID=109376 RepID=A0A0D3A6X4_BRAOL